MKREILLAQLDRQMVWDLMIVGGGATGLGATVEAASRGLKVILTEQSDFCKGTSSKSTKLIHGGVRYLQQGNLRLVSDALRERRTLLKNAPHLVHPIRFYIPVFNPWQLAYYGTGLKLYDFLARDRGIEKSKLCSKEMVIQSIPTLRKENLTGGVRFCDALFDDAKLGISLARTAADQGALLLNYMRLDSFLKTGGKITGGILRDEFSNQQFEVQARMVVNATGPFSDMVQRLDDPSQEKKITASRGSHVVLDSTFLPSEDALLIPRTQDGRVLFAIPWKNHLLCGTTDVAVSDVSLEPRPPLDDLDYILEHLGQYLNKVPQKSDIRSVFAGFRPLVRSSGKTGTSAMPRDHFINFSDSGLVSIIGGKWTTYRKMAQDLVDRIAQRSKIDLQPSNTAHLALYGSPDYAGSRDEINPGPAWEGKDIQQKLVEFSEDRFLDVIRAVRMEWACTVEDILARRTRILFLDARKAIEIAPVVAGIMARELGKNNQWETDQIHSFQRLAERYLPRKDLKTEKNF